MHSLPLLSSLENSSYTLVEGSRTRQIDEGQEKFRIQVSCKYNAITYLFRVVVGALVCILTLGSAYSSEHVANLFSKTYTLLVIDDRQPKQERLQNTKQHAVAIAITTTPTSVVTKTDTSSKIEPKIRETNPSPSTKNPPVFEEHLTAFRAELPDNYSSNRFNHFYRFQCLQNASKSAVDLFGELSLPGRDITKPNGYIQKTRLLSSSSQQPVCAHKVNMPGYNNAFVISTHPQIALKTKITPHHLTAFFDAGVTLIVDLTHPSEEEKVNRTYAIPYCPEKAGEQKIFNIDQTSTYASIKCESNDNKGTCYCTFKDSEGNSHPFQYWRCDYWEEYDKPENMDAFNSLVQRLVHYANEKPDDIIAIHCMDGAGRSACLMIFAAIVADMNINRQLWSEKTYLERIASFILYERSQHTPHAIELARELQFLEEETLKLLKQGISN